MFNPLTYLVLIVLINQKERDVILYNHFTQKLIKQVFVLEDRAKFKTNNLVLNYCVCLLLKFTLCDLYQQYSPV